jgi:hypothetical protein
MPQGSLTWCKSLHEADGFTSPLKEGVLRTFIALKIHRPRPGLNPRTLLLPAKYLCHTPQGYLTWRKNLHEADDFTSPLKEGVLPTVIALKIHRPRPGLNPRTLGPMVSTITTRPPRTVVTLDVLLNFEIDTPLQNVNLLLRAH